LPGEEAFDTYAHHLRTFGEPMLPYEGLLWIFRVVLIVAVIGHVYAAFTLWSRAGTARTKYAVAKTAMRTASGCGGAGSSSCSSSSGTCCTSRS
jgi:succinate dehydrogenase / fumarate reductase cytochrome b subunit